VQTKDYIEVRLDDGTTVGFERKIVESIEKGATEVPASAPQGGTRSRDDGHAARWRALRGRLHGR
jgi:hypothetical protein